MTTEVANSQEITPRPKELVRESGTRVRSLGYVIVDAISLEAWKEFGSTLLGLQVSHEDPTGIEFRMDEKEYRLIVRKAECDGVNALGWEVGGAKDLEHFQNLLNANGFETRRFSDKQRKLRRVSDGITFRDPDNLLDIELHYGLRESSQTFISPVGASFVTGPGGMGHVFQTVSNNSSYENLYFNILGFNLSDHIESGTNGDVDLTFAYCNHRHHSFAFASIPNVPSAIGHVMFEVDELDIVGRSWDRVVEEGAAPILSTLGKHTNDKMVSFYVRSPSGFGVEFGTGGILIDENIWTPTRYSDAHYWGHSRVAPINPTDPADNT